MDVGQDSLEKKALGTEHEKKIKQITYLVFCSFVVVVGVLRQGLTI